MCRGPPAESQAPPLAVRTWPQSFFVSGNASSSLGHDNRCFVRGGRVWGVSSSEGLPPGPADVG